MRGPPGSSAEGIQLNPYIVAFHSQTTDVPICPRGMTKLWDGFSFMFIDGK